MGLTLAVARALLQHSIPYEQLEAALGRPVEEVAAWNAGRELIDDDVVMKARGIAMNRGVHIE